MVADRGRAGTVPPVITPAPAVSVAQLLLGLLAVVSRRPMMLVVGPHPPIVPTSHRRNVDAQGVSHVPRYTLPKLPRRPIAVFRVEPLAPAKSKSRSIFTLNSYCTQPVMPPPRLSEERMPKFDAWLATDIFDTPGMPPVVSQFPCVTVLRRVEGHVGGTVDLHRRLRERRSRGGQGGRHCHSQ